MQIQERSWQARYLFGEPAGPGQLGKVTLAERTPARISVPRSGRGPAQKRPLRIIADRDYDSDQRRWWLLQRGMLLICLHRQGRRNPSLNHGRTLCNYRKRWNTERMFA